MYDDIEPDSLQDQRHDAVVAAIRGAGARSVLDLGCNAGDLLVRLADLPELERILGLDLSPAAVAEARRRTDPERVRVMHGSFADPLPALRGFDAAALVETIEHIDPGRLSPVERNVFTWCRPATVVITTPNREYNVHYGLDDDEYRHPDHRFEWTRARFRDWAERVAKRNGYRVRFEGIGDADPFRGHPTQMAVFTRA